MNSFDMLIKRQIKLTILTVIAVILMTVTVSYALYQTNHENTTNQVISIGSLGLTATGTPITLNGLYPMEEYDLTDSYPKYEFTLENKTDNVYNDYTLMYELVLTPTSQDFIASDYQYIMYKIDGMEAAPLSEAWDADINGYKILDGRLLSHDESLLATSLNGKDTENHSIVFWLSTTAPNSMNGKSVGLSMTLSAYADRFNYLKWYDYATNNVFGKAINRSDFESITTVDDLNIPSNAIDSWDVSQKQNGEIMAWYTDNDSNNLYELYIGQIGGVIANPNSSTLFQNYRNVTAIDVSNFDTSLVTSMNRSFQSCEKIGLLNMTAFDTSNVTTMNNTFQGCHNLVTVQLGEKWNTSKVTNMSATFYNCFNLSNIDYGKFDTSNVIDMSYIFTIESNVTRDINLNLSTWDTSKVTNISNMFYKRKGQITIDISNMTFDSVTNYYSSMFANINDNTTTIITNECTENFVRARLADANKSNATVIVKPCVKVCYSKNTLPSTYTELEHIESTGTQYIDTGYKPSPNTGIYADFQFTDIVTTQQRLYGVTSDSGSNVISYDFYINSSNQFAYSYQDNTGNWSSTDKKIDAYRHIVSFNKNNDKNLYIDDGATYSGNIIGSPTYTSPYNMYIMATYHNNNGAAAGYSKFKLYSFQIYESGTLVRNYVPAMRNSDNELGLYETINDVFYENSGTGTFNTSASKTLTGDTMQIIEKVDARAGYTFIGWNTKPDGTGTMFKQGEEVDATVLKSIGDEITLYAIWEAN